jgi:hypothetical protein
VSTADDHRIENRRIHYRSIHYRHINDRRIDNNRMEYQDYFKKQMGPRDFGRDQNGRLILQQGQ